MDEKFKLKVILSKQGRMRYSSQLDLVRVLERALRRTGLPLYYTKGFNPHVKMSFTNALKLGVEGEIGVVFYFSQDTGPSLLKEKLTPQLPEGILIVDVATV
ncbi:MAG: TIGR03936 family radical SAM-associated protein [Candidatus Omnitrophota bacterium]